MCPNESCFEEFHPDLIAIPCFACAGKHSFFQTIKKERELGRGSHNVTINYSPPKSPRSGITFHFTFQDRVKDDQKNIGILLILTSNETHCHICGCNSFIFIVIFFLLFELNILCTFPVWSLPQKWQFFNNTNSSNIENLDKVQFSK